MLSFGDCGCCLSHKFLSLLQVRAGGDAPARQVLHHLVHPQRPARRLRPQRELNVRLPAEVHPQDVRHHHSAAVHTGPAQAGQEVRRVRHHRGNYVHSYRGRISHWYPGHVINSSLRLLYKYNCIFSCPSQNNRAGKFPPFFFFERNLSHSAASDFPKVSGDIRPLLFCSL